MCGVNKVDSPVYLSSSGNGSAREKDETLDYLKCFLTLMFCSLQVLVMVMMGGEQSHERKEREDETEKHEESAKTDISMSAASEDAPTELPQCKMGNRKVDNMCFMISCTNCFTHRLNGFQIRGGSLLSGLS
ncbi:hypothetical protein L3Q82_007478 [Scortum barcoo]|uniref:Uncharacterized protein n=1 Tax=Scortum barcoo TaxID=214431 RepID=A0ACB8WNK0_9TELE|nr:hypothetical protein L3Q82_007478 [Scortum barcoo]